MMEDECGCVIEDLLKHSFSSRTFTAKKLIIDNGKPTLNISAMVTERRGKVRRFNDSWYTSDTWLCGCIAGIASYFQQTQMYGQQREFVMSAIIMY